MCMILLFYRGGKSFLFKQLSMMTSVRKRQSAADFAYQELKRKIIELEYPPMLKLTEDRLSRTLEISRTPLRQALYRLEAERLIVKQANGRIYVAPVTAAEAEEIFKVREVLEGLIAREACIGLEEKALIRLEDVLEMEKKAAAHGRKTDFVHYGSEFHQLIRSASTNETAKRYLDELDTRAGRYRRISGYMNPDYHPMTAVEEHIRIFTCIQIRDEVNAEKAMRKHIRRSLESAKKTLAAYLREPPSIK